MKFYFGFIVLLTFNLSSCGQDLLQTNTETLGSYSVSNPNFYLNISKVNGGATSSNFMQICRVYNDSTYEIVKNIANVDSIVEFKYYLDTIKLLVRGKQSSETIENDTVKFSINDIFIQGRRKKAN
jgi:hypothetical protein